MMCYSLQPSQVVSLRVNESPRMENLKISTGGVYERQSPGALKTQAFFAVGQPVKTAVRVPVKEEQNMLSSGSAARLYLEITRSNDLYEWLARRPLVTNPLTGESIVNLTFDSESGTIHVAPVGEDDVMIRFHVHRINPFRECAHVMVQDENGELSHSIDSDILDSLSPPAGTTIALQEVDTTVIVLTKDNKVEVRLTEEMI